MLYVQLTQLGFVARSLWLISLDLWHFSHGGFTLHCLSLCNEELRKMKLSINLFVSMATEVAAIK